MSKGQIQHKSFLNIPVIDWVYFLGIPVVGAIFTGGLVQETIDIALIISLTSYWFAYLLLIWWSMYLFSFIGFQLMAPWRPPLWAVCTCGPVFGGFLMLYPVGVFSELGYEWFDPDLMPAGPMWPDMSWDFFSYYLKFTVAGLILWVSFNYCFAAITDNFRFCYPEPKNTETDANVQDEFKKLLTAIKPSAIETIEAQENYIQISTAQSQQLLRYPISKAVSALEALAIDGVRIHRSYWVAKNMINSLEKVAGKNRLKLNNGDSLPVSRTYLSSVKTLVIAANKSEDSQKNKGEI